MLAPRTGPLWAYFGTVTGVEVDDMLGTTEMLPDCLPNFPILTCGSPRHRLQRPVFICPSGGIGIRARFRWYRKLGAITPQPFPNQPYAHTRGLCKGPILTGFVDLIVPIVQLCTQRKLAQ